MSSSEILNNCKIEIRSILISYQNGCSLPEFLKEYENLIGKRLPAKEFGFKTNIEFLNSMPDVVKTNSVRKGVYHLRAVANEKVKHIQKMVAKQKSENKRQNREKGSKSKGTHLHQPGSSSRTSVSSSMQFKESKDVPNSTLSQKSIPKELTALQTSILKEPKLSRTDASKNNTKLSPKDEIILLVQKHKNELLLSDLQVEYRRMYNKNLHLSMYGFSSLEECIDCIAELNIVRKNNIDFVVNYTDLQHKSPRNEDQNSYEVRSGWQHYLMNIQEALCYMYKYKIGTDITIQATNAENGSMCFAVHKMVLAMRSTVFADLFNGNSQQNCILTANFSPRVLDILLWYIYSDIIEGDTIEELIDSFEAATYYKIYSFYVNCIKKLENLSADINVNNVCSMLKIAHYSKSTCLQHKCLEFMKKEPEKTFLSKDFVTLNVETVLKVLKLSNLNLCPKIKLKTVINWMQRNEVHNRLFLSNIDFSTFSANDFLDVVEEYPNFFSGEEMHGILSNLTFPKPSAVPKWCKLPKIKDQRNVSNTMYECLELIKKYATKLKTNASQKFSKFMLHSHSNFEEEILLKIIIRMDELKLVMLELAFGSDYIPISNLTIELCCNVGVRKKMVSIKYHLISSLHNYYLLLPNNFILKAEKDLNLLLKVKVANLHIWGSDGPISNQKYKVATVPNYVNIKTERTGILEIANLKTFSEWVLFIDPESGEKKFLVSALYFDNFCNIQKYLKHFKFIS